MCKDIVKYKIKWYNYKHRRVIKMDTKELTLIYEKYQRQINDIWRSL